MVEPDFGDPVILLDAVTVRDLPTPASAVGVPVVVDFADRAIEPFAGADGITRKRRDRQMRRGCRSVATSRRPRPSTGFCAGAASAPSTLRAAWFVDSDHGAIRMVRVEGRCGDGVAR